MLAFHYIKSKLTLTLNIISDNIKNKQNHKRKQGVKFLNNMNTFENNYSLRMMTKHEKYILRMHEASHALMYSYYNQNNWVIRLEQSESYNAYTELQSSNVPKTSDYYHEFMIMSSISGYIIEQILGINPDSAYEDSYADINVFKQYMNLMYDDYDGNVNAIINKATIIILNNMKVIEYIAHKLEYNDAVSNDVIIQNSIVR